MSRSRLELDRAAILGHRRRAGALDARLPPGPDSLRVAAWAGLQDSAPRAALLSIHARVEGTRPSSWEDPSLVQLWGPRYAAYVVAAEDLPVFSLGRMPDDPVRRRADEALASRLEAFLAGRRMPYGAAGRGLGVHPNLLRYPSVTGRLLIRWDGARGSIVWTVPPPDVDPSTARLELARRHLRVLGPGTPAAVAWWAGVGPREARAAFDALAGELVPVSTPGGDAWILAEDEASFRSAPGHPGRARLLPSGDAWLLVPGAERSLLVPDAARAAELWTGRVPPGAVLLDGEIAGVWLRAGLDMTIRPWTALSPDDREAVESEAASLPLPEDGRRIRVRWEG